MIRGAGVSIKLALLLPVLFGLGGLGVIAAVSLLTRNEAGAFFKFATVMLVVPTPTAWLALKLRGRHSNQDATVSSIAFSIWLGIVSWIGLSIGAGFVLNHFQHDVGEALFWALFLAWIPTISVISYRLAAGPKSLRLRAAQNWALRCANLLTLAAILIPRLEPGPHQRLRFAAGWGARDCGAFNHASYDDPANDLTPDEIAAIRTCSRDALRDGKAMFFSLRLKGMDSDIATGLVRSASGSLLRLRYDHMSCDIVGFCGTYADFRPCPHDPNSVVDPLISCAEPLSETRDYSSIW